jgi:CheY-like chemotaxis protein
MQRMGDPIDSPRVRVLVVDDNAALAEALVELVEAAGLAPVVRAASADEALRLQHDHRADAVLVDLRLPDMSGLALAARLRTSYPTTTVVVMSADSTDPAVVPKASLTPASLRAALGLAADDGGNGASAVL